jgi:hypothetical protein
MIEIFKQYKAAGLATLPTKADKSPNSPHWKEGVNDEHLYGTSPGIGVVCGKISGGLECIDFDNHFGDAKETISSFMLIEEVREIIERTNPVIEATMSGGFHMLYRCDVIGGNQKLARKPKQGGNGKWVPDVIIETRGEGGYFVAAPSPGYTLLRGQLTAIPVIDPLSRDILISAAKSFNTWHEIVPSVEEIRDRPGDVFNGKFEAVDEMRSSLSNAGWKEIREGIWQRPGKKDGVSATLGRVAPGVFYNFSSNGHPFESECAYTAFQVVTLLDYNGDFSAFAKELAERYDMNSKEKKINKPKPTEKTESELDKSMREALIDFKIPVEKPPIIMRIRQKIMTHGRTENYDSRIFSLGNFSAITGKGKSKKTFLTSLLLSAASSMRPLQDKIIPDIPENKRHTIMFDTEQSRYDAYITGSRIPRITNEKTDRFRAFTLREYTPMERCNIIEHILSKYNGSAGYIVIDGIADLATAINDEEEATLVVSLLMRWTKDYDCHITTVIHQNKGNEFATGHLGSGIIKKAEGVIIVEKDENERAKSHVKCDLIRGAGDFDDFSFEINDEGIPLIDKDNGYRNVEPTGF